MSRARLYRLLVNVVLMALLFGTAPKHTADLGDPAFKHNIVGAGEASGEGLEGELVDAPPFQRDLFQAATELSRSLHERSLESRTGSDYRQAIDAYDTVARMGADERLAARSLARAADLMREMADAAGDYTHYNRATENFRKIIQQYPQSSYVGYSLISIAQVYEESLQDLDGAASAYRDLINHFPQSVLAREAGAILARYDAEMGSARNAPDVLVDDKARTLAVPLDRAANLTWLNNVRNFAGPDYARVVIDLSDSTGFKAAKSGNDKVLISLAATVARTLDGRRFIIRDGRFLKHISVSQPGTAGATVEIQAAGLANYTAFELSSPPRLVIDLHSNVGMTPEAQVAKAAARSVQQVAVAREATGVVPDRPVFQPRSSLGGAILSLPDVDVSNLDKIAADGEHRQGTGLTVGPASTSQDASSRASATTQDNKGADT